MAQACEHGLVRPLGEVVWRPCNSYCRGVVHAHLVFAACEEGPQFDAAELRRIITKHNPDLTVVDIEQAPEAVPYPDMRPGYRFGWLARVAHPEGCLVRVNGGGDDGDHGGESAGPAPGDSGGAAVAAREPVRPAGPQPGGGGR